MALTGVSPLFIGTVVVYFLVILGIGYYGYIRTTDEEDFLVAGREIGPVVGGATLSATQMSAGTLVGTFGIHYLLGFGFIWIWPGLWAGWIVSLLLVAPQMRRFGRVTVPDFIAVRYGDDGANGNYSRAIGAILIVIAYTVYLSAQVTGGGIIFQSILGLDPEIGIITMALIAVFYTSIGGMRASILTDFVQAIIMAVAVVIALPLSFTFVGGLGTVNAIFQSFNPSFVGQALSTQEIVGFMAAFGFSIAAAPYEITRIYSMKDEKTVRQAIGITLIFQSIIGTSVALLAIYMRIMFPALSNPDLASVIMSLNVLGPILGALLVCAIFSAILSTVDSVMIVSGAGLAHDIYVQLFNPDASERQKVWANRIAIAILGLIPLALALNRGLVGDLVQLIVVLQASMMGAMFFMPLVLGLHWRRATTAGGVAGMIFGFSTVVIWHVGTEILSYIPESLAGYDPVIPGVIVSFIVMVTISYATKKPSPESLAPFFDNVVSVDGGSDSDQDT
ncbi:sodium:solute symporter family protein [Haladaptatus caseinilyticus]|uniref:sodium:solute symporter family protein n=1 Tax=Haladaptatus caseinilyticus TaxID=2993314 RepID=UPI00224A620B|nr:sodium/solute symporter [Haladaptatus caseinilyticus]